MKKFVICTMLLALAHGVPTSVEALTVSALIGDKDGFGTGAADGDLILPGDLITELDDDPITDRLLFGPETLTFDYDLSGLASITGATLTLFTGGQGLGLFATTELYVDGSYVGLLSDGEIGLFSFAKLDIFDLSTFPIVFDGNSTVEIRVKYGIDAWILDYAELTFTGDPVSTTPSNPGSPVPEPATLSLLGIGLVGLVLRQRHITL